ncbi:unnamed protein product, partial [Meganyctiphanes norvegica]
MQLESSICAVAERALMRTLEGGCSAPVAVHSKLTTYVWYTRSRSKLESDICMYAVGQGALAVECREGDTATLELLSCLSHQESSIRAVAERALMRTLEGGCSAPVAVHSKIENGKIVLKGGVWSLDGGQELVNVMSTDDLNELEEESNDTNEDCGPPPNKSAKLAILDPCGLVPPMGQTDQYNKAYHLGVKLAKSLLDMGALPILEEAKLVNGANAPNIPPQKKPVDLKNESNGNSLLAN